MKTLFKNESFEIFRTADRRLKKHDLVDGTINFIPCYFDENGVMKFA